MALFGRIDEFRDEAENWTQYHERLEQIFIANDIDEDKQRAVLLSVCGAKTYSLVRSLLAPAKPNDKTFKEICELLERHHCPRPSVIVQRYKFNMCVRKPGVSVASYVAKLRKLSEYCDYGANLDEMIRDRIVCGINDDRTQRRLLSESTLDFKKAMEIAQGMEVAARNIIDLHAQNPSSHTGSVNKFYNPNKKKHFKRPSDNSGQCFRCGENHDPSTCKFINAKCYSCSARGHISPMCRDKNSQQRVSQHNQQHNQSQRMSHQPQNQRPSHQPQNQRPSHQQNSRSSQGARPRRPNYVHDVSLVQFPVENNDDSQEYSSAYALYNIKSKNEPVIVSVTLDNNEMSMEVDTGAALSIISESTYDKYFSDYVLTNQNDPLSTYTGELINIKGYFDVNVSLSHMKSSYRLPLVVVGGTGPSLLGRNWLHYVRLDWHSLFRIQRSALSDVLARHSDVFKPELGTLRDHQVSIHVDPTARPRFFKARPLPYALRERVDAEIDRLLRLGIIIPVKQSKWAAPVVPVVKGDDSIRLCGDYKVITWYLPEKP